MKTIKILFLVLFASLSSFAQDPQLFENDWYLQKVIIDDIDYFPPGINGEGVNIPLNFYAITEYLTTSLCTSISVSCSYSSSENLFTTLGDWFIFGFPCVHGDNITFADLYYTSIWRLNINQSFDLSYLIENDGNNKKLTITNNEGNQAIYGNELLPIKDFDISFFELYPSPVTNKLFISKISDYTNFKVLSFSFDFFSPSFYAVNKFRKQNL